MDKRKLSELLVEHKEKAIGDHAFTPREILAQAADMARQKEIHVITGVRRSGKSTLMRLIALYLASNLSCLASYKKLKDTITVNSLTTVKNYLGYFEDVYLFFPVNLFDYSLKRQVYNPAKIYCVDHALAAAMAFKFSADTGGGYWKTSFSASSKCAVARSITGRTKTARKWIF